MEVEVIAVAKQINYWNGHFLSIICWFKYMSYYLLYPSHDADIDFVLYTNLKHINVNIWSNLDKFTDFP